MNIQRLKFAAARGARIQWCVPGAPAEYYREWHDAPQTAAFDCVEGCEYRIHPEDEHLQYGPVSTAFRDMALFTDSSDLDEVTEMFMDLAGSNWVLGGAGTNIEVDFARLFFAEMLADEGL